MNRRGHEVFATGTEIKTAVKRRVKNEEAPLGRIADAIVVPILVVRIMAAPSEGKPWN
jgi:hypothetical protein